MFSFDGQFRRTREQNLAGASRLAVAGKHELIDRAHRERERRQNERTREVSAIIIQKVIRGYLCRLELRKQLASECSKYVERRQNQTPIIADIEYLLTRIYRISKEQFHPTLAYVFDAAVVLCVEIIHLSSQDDSWVRRLYTLLNYALNGLKVFLESSHSQPFLLWKCGQVLNTFTCLSNYDAAPNSSKKVFQCLMNEKKFAAYIEDHVYALTLNRNNSADDEYKTQINVDIHFFLDILVRPIYLLDQAHDDDFRDTILRAVMLMVACDKLFPDLMDHVIPACKTLANFPLARAVELFLESFGSEACGTSILYFSLLMDKNQTEFTQEEQSNYFKLLSKLTTNITVLHQDQSPYSEKKSACLLVKQKSMIESCWAMLNSETRCHIWKAVLDEALDNTDHATVACHASCILNILINNLEPHRHRMVKEHWNHEGWLRGLWVALEAHVRCNQYLDTITENTTLLSVLKRGKPLTQTEAAAVLPLLAVFCYYLFSELSFITDEDLLAPELKTTNGLKPFTINELIYIGCTLKDVAIGLISLGFPDPHIPMEERVNFNTPTNNLLHNSVVWMQTLKYCTKLVSEIYLRQERCSFTSSADWHSFLLPIPDNGLACYADVHCEMDLIPPFSVVCDQWIHTKMERAGIWYDRAFFLLSTLPFSTEFSKRYSVLRNVLSDAFVRGSIPDPRSTIVNVRRLYIYEDSFQQFALDKGVHDLRISFKIRFMNKHGMEEPGIDGGGLFKEFITELLQTAFDPNRGFFSITKDNKLYPNPLVDVVHPDFLQHYKFIGRMLAKAIYENIVVDIPLAEFFLSAILNPDTLFPSLLHSLDNDFHKHISFLRSYNGDLSELSIDFSTLLNGVGTLRTIPLIPFGPTTLLSKDNVMEYLHLLSEQKLLLDILPQSTAFAEGLGEVIPLHMLKIFTPYEFQRLIAGCPCVNLDDFKAHVSYAGGYHAEHENILMFWDVVQTFTQHERGMLLKFVTSCSRPPLCGFKELHPPFCIQLVEDRSIRLPTSSTCMNMMKLPIYNNVTVMREKLLYAIHSGAGFELS